MVYSQSLLEYIGFILILRRNNTNTFNILSKTYIESQWRQIVNTIAFQTLKPLLRQQLLSEYLFSIIT